MIVIVFIIYWRVFRLRESAVWAAAKRDRDHMRETILLFYHFWHRSIVLRLPLALACGKASSAKFASA